MTGLPLVSIITPSYNQGQFLEETILSVLKQDYPNIEYIIIDGGSSDNSVEIIKNYGSRIAYWVSEKDEGQTHAIIKGLRRANGTYFTWLCSDDILEPSMVRISVSFMEKYPECGITFGDRVRIDAKGNIYSFNRYTEFKKWHLSCGLTIPQETVMIRKEIYDKTKKLDQNLRMAMDFDLWCKLSKITDFCHIPTYLGRFRSHTCNKSSIFTSQIGSVGFSGDLTEEFSIVYKNYFSQSLSYKKMQSANKLRSIIGFFDRRTKKYKNKIQILEQIHKD